MDEETKNLSRSLDNGRKRLPGEISFSRMLWQLSIFLMGFVLLIAVHIMLNNLIGEMNHRTANEQSRLMVGELIIQSIQTIESDLYKMATTVGIKGQSIIRQNINQQVYALSDALEVLTDGGTIKKQLRLNMAGRDRMIREIRYKPEPQRSTYVLEAIDLAPKINQINQKIDQLFVLLKARENARDAGDKQTQIESISQIKKMLRGFNPMFVRLKENANRLFYNSHQRMQELESAVLQKQRLFYWTEAILAFLIIIFAMLFGYIFAGQIVSSNARLRAAHDDMESAKLEAETANQSKSRFLSNMSHELRTPLNAILGFTQLLQIEKDMQSVHKKSLGEIENAGKHLLTLINDVLDLAKVEAGKCELSIEPVSVGHLIQDACTLTKNLADQRDIHLHHAADADDLVILGDYTRIKQVLLNLLSNGIKYNHRHGSLHVRCELQATDRVRINITDTGHGIAEKDKAKIFRPFSRLERAVSNIEGTGIGLVLTKRLVETMGGVIGFESSPGIGSTFWVEFSRYQGERSPLMPEVHQTPEVVSEDFAERRSVPGKLLLLEDNPVNQVLIEQQLMVLGYTADMAENGSEGLNLLKDNEYALVLTDCNMPVMDGYQFTETVRRQEAGGKYHIPIIAITANAMQGDTVRCFESGMDDYIAKPVSLDKLKTTLEKWLSGAEREDSTAGLASSAVTATDDKASVSGILVDTSSLEELFGDNPQLISKLYQTFLESAGSSVNSILGAYNKHRYSDIAFQAHKLKSSAKAVGAIDLAQTTQALESAATEENWERISTLVYQFRQQLDDVKKHLDREESISSVDTAGLSNVAVQQLPAINCLIVDDDQFMLEHLRTLLHKAGVTKISMAEAGDEALRLLNDNKHKINLIICDLNMPSMDGITFLRYAADSGYRGDIIPVSGEDHRVLVTSAELAKAHKLNVLGILQKPVDFTELTKLLPQPGEKAYSKASQGIDSDKEIPAELLKQAIESDALTVHYQPKISVAERRFVAVEALTRWDDSNLGYISPNIFIPIAEEQGLIGELTRLVSRKSIEQLGHWKRSGLKVKVAINFSMACFNQLDLPEWLLAVAQQFDIDPEDIIIEVTESGLIDNMTAALEILTRMRLMGFALSIDDFGTGYSTLNQLKRLPFSEFKIDRSFVHGAHHDPTAFAIFEASVNMAKKMGLSTVAEGVEDIQDWKLAERLGCDEVQGYFIAKPMPAEDLTEWHQRWKQTGHRFIDVRDIEPGYLTSPVNP